MPTLNSVKRELSGTCIDGESEGLLCALVSGLQAMVTLPAGTHIEVVTKYADISSLINLGFARWSNHSWRREVNAVAADSPTWRKLAKASRHFSLSARLPHSREDFEMLGRADHCAHCALGSGKAFRLFTDGSFVAKNRAGGWAAILEDGKQSREAYGSMACRDCNQAELVAVIKGLDLLSDDDSAIVFTDSRFVVTGTRLMDIWMDSNWRTIERRKVPHRPLWEALREHMQRLDVHFEWIKGHSGIEQNFRADFLAKREAKGLASAECSTQSP